MTGKINLSQEDISTILDLARDGRARFAEFAFGLARWLYTSLMIINGAAAVAVISASELNASSRGWAGLWYGIGVLMALLAILYALHYLTRFSPNMIAIRALSPGTYDIDYIEMITSGPPANEPWKDPAILVGAAPIACFVIGGAIVFEGIGV